MSAETFLLYLGTWFLVALSPGPAVMCAMTQASRHGFRPSLAGISGVQAGNLLFFICTALGLAALLERATAAFTVLRVVGAAYLFYLGVRIIWSTFRRLEFAVPGPGRGDGLQPQCRLAAQRGLFLQGALIQITNPKALIFVSALLPQFIDSSQPLAWQLLILALTTIAVDGVVLSSYAFLAEKGLCSFRASRLAIWLERLFGTALIFFGLRLLFSRNGPAPA